MSYRVLSDLRFRRPDSYGKALFRHSLKKRITVISSSLSKGSGVRLQRGQNLPSQACGAT